MRTGIGICCSICGGGLTEHFGGRVLGRIEVTYLRCEECRSLLLPEPWWIEEAYGRRWVPDPDGGSLRRSLVVHRVIRRLRATGLLATSHRSLDFGCGKGELLRLLMDEGQDAWGLDRYPSPVYAEERVVTEWPAGEFELITAIEVLEHLPEPGPVLTEIAERLTPAGVCVASTVLFDEKRHGADWPYLAQEFGQHVTLYSESGLDLAAAHAGLRRVATLPWFGEDCLHVLVPVNRAVDGSVLARLSRLHGASESREADDGLA